MKKSILFLVLLISLVFFNSCEKEKEDPKPKLEGNFNGTFTFDGDIYSFSFENIRQTGESLSGLVRFGAGSGNFANSYIRGDEVYIQSLVSSSSAALTFKFDGTTNAERNKINGFLTLCIGTDCVSAGTFSAYKSGAKSSETINEKSASSLESLEEFIRAVSR